LRICSRRGARSRGVAECGERNGPAAVSYARDYPGGPGTAGGPGWPGAACGSQPQRRVRAVRGPLAAGPPKQTVRADASAHRISPHPSRAGAILSSPSILHSPPGFTARRTQRRACRAPSLFQTAPRHSGAPQASPEPITPSVSEQGAAAIDAFSPAPSAAMGSGLSRCSPRNDGEWHSQ